MPYYRHSNFTLYQANCLDFLPKLNDESIDLIFSDPPYRLSNGGFSVRGGRRVPVDKGRWDRSRGVDADFNFHFRWIAACRRVLRSAGTIWITGTYHCIHQIGFCLQQQDFKIINDIIWFKPNAAPNLSGRCFAASHESLIWAKKDNGSKHTFNYHLLKHRNWPGDTFKRPRKQMKSIWMFEQANDFWPISSSGLSEKRQGRHPTQKPLALLRRIILASSHRGDLILDPFAGSSTTGIAAYELNRSFIGIEKEREYLDLSVRRYQAHFLDSIGSKGPAIKAGVLTN